jgi:hypothetical protein
MFLLDSGLHVAADVTEEPAAARDADNAAPLVTAEGRWAAAAATRRLARHWQGRSGPATGRAGLAPQGRRRLGPWTHAGWNRHCTAPSTGSGNFKPRPGRPLHPHAAETGVDTVHVALECKSARGATNRAVPQTCRAATLPIDGASYRHLSAGQKYIRGYFRAASS